MSIVNDFHVRYNSLLLDKVLLSNNSHKVKGFMPGAFHNTVYPLCFSPNLKYMHTNDSFETAANEAASGNLFSNDINAEHCAVIRVNRSAVKLGIPVTGSSGGLFTVNSDGSWEFQPNSEFDYLSGTDTVNTYVLCATSNGEIEVEYKLTGTISAAADNSFRYFKFIITATTGSASRASINELRFFDADDNPYPSVAMTAINAPSPLICVHSSSYSSGTYCWKAFNQISDASVDGWVASTGSSLPQWITLDLGVGNSLIPAKIGIVRGQFPSGYYCYPSAFSLYGSNTGAFAGEETLIYSTSGVTTGWTTAWRYFTI